MVRVVGKAAKRGIEDLARMAVGDRNGDALRQAPEPQAPETALEGLGRRGKASIEKLAAAARSPLMQGDGYREIIIAQIGMVEFQLELASELHQMRAPISDSDRAALALEVAVVVKRESQRWYSAFDRRSTLQIAALIAGFFVIGAVAGAAIFYRLTMR